MTIKTIGFRNVLVSGKQYDASHRLNKKAYI